MKITLSNSELVALERELVEVLTQKIPINLKVKGLDLADDLAAVLKSYYKVYQEILDEHGKLSEDKSRYDFEDEQGPEKLKELAEVTSELEYNKETVKRILDLDLEISGVPFLLRKLKNNG